MVISSAANMNTDCGYSFRIYTTSLIVNGGFSKLASWTTKAVQYCGEKIDTYSKYTALVAGCKAIKSKFPIAAQFFEIALMEKDERDYTIKEMGGEVLTPKQTEERFKEMGVNDMKFIKKEKPNLYTYVLPEKSKISNVLNNYKEVQDLVKSWYNDFSADNKPKRGKLSTGLFTSENKNKEDLYFTLGRFNVIGFKDLGNGYVQAYVEDVYDFDDNYGKLNFDDPKKATINDSTIYKTVQICTEMQNKGLLSNYRVLIPIKVKVK